MMRRGVQNEGALGAHIYCRYDGEGVLRYGIWGYEGRATASQGGRRGGACAREILRPLC